MKRKHLILCIDDNEHNLFTLTSLMQQLDDVEVVTATSGRAGLDLLLTKKVDLILLDIQMPLMDGYEIARLVKQNKRTSHIPIVFLTSVYKSDEFVKKGYKEGAVDYLTKPIDNHQLLNKVKLYLNLFRQRDVTIREQNRFAHLAQSIEEGIYVLSSDFRISYINPKALEMLGYSEKEVVGKMVHDKIHCHHYQPNQICAEQCPIHKALKEKVSYISDDESLMRKDGSCFPVSVAASALQESVDEYSMVVVFKDITHLKEQEEQAKALLKIKKQRLLEEEALVDSLVKMIDQRDRYTAGHAQRVAHYCLLIAREMGYNDKEVEELNKAARLHDIGKIATPDTILLKPGKLNKLEYTLIQEHLTAGHGILKGIPNYGTIAEIMRYHHERYDGGGYPDGKKADEIPPLARIMIVADAFDAMTTNRIYKPRKKLHLAIEELRELSGIQFHPEVVDAAVNILSGVKIHTDIDQEPHTVLEQERFAYFFKDQLTGFYSSDSLMLRLRESFAETEKYFLLFSLLNFSRYNREKGWEEGDRFLKEVSAYLMKQLSEGAYGFRVQGDDFLLVSSKPMALNEEELKIFFFGSGTIVGYKISLLHCSKEEAALEDKIAQFIRSC